MSLHHASKRGGREKDKVTTHGNIHLDSITSNLLPVTYTSLPYIYVNLDISNSIKNILFNQADTLQEVLSLKKDINRDNCLSWIDKHLDKFLFPISSLYFLYLTDKRIETELDYINLNGKILQSILGSHRSGKIMDFLIQNEFIECDNHFIKGAKSHGYRFGPKWRQKLIEGQLKFKRRETNLEIRESYVDNINNKDFVLSQLYQLEFNGCLAREIAEDYLKSLSLSDQIKKGRYYEFIIDAWDNNDHFLKESKKSGRIFTLLSSTPRILRKCLSLGGQPLMSCDIKSCQPLLLHTFYKEECQESIKYKQLVESGLFYQHIIESLFVDFNPKSKEKYKEIIWEWAFGTKYMQEFKIVNQFFLDSFPKLTKLLIKSKDRIEAGEKRPHSKTAIHLQKMEANVMVKELIEYCKLNNLFYLTIHDSVLAPEDQINKLSLFISDKFKAKYNLAPNFEIKLVD